MGSSPIIRILLSLLGGMVNTVDLKSTPLYWVASSSLAVGKLYLNLVRYTSLNKQL